MGDVYQGFFQGQLDLELDFPGTRQRPDLSADKFLERLQRGQGCRQLQAVGGLFSGIVQAPPPP
jgi:hypothetical protein